MPQLAWPSTPWLWVSVTVWVRYTGHGGYVVRYHPHPAPHLPQLPDHQDHEEEHPCPQQDV